jgi:hypothetical protein
MICEIVGFYRFSVEIFALLGYSAALVGTNYQPTQHNFPEKQVSHFYGMFASKDSNKKLL